MFDVVSKKMSGKKLIAFFVTLSLFAAYIPTAVFAAGPATVEVTEGTITQTAAKLNIAITDNGSTIPPTGGTLSYTAVAPASGGGSMAVTTSKEYSISGLTAGTTYDYEVTIPYSYDNGGGDAGSGNAIATGSFTTEAAPPPTPTVTTDSINYNGTTNKITFTGTVTTNGATILERGFAYVYSNSTPTTGNFTATVSSNSMSAEIAPTAGTSTCKVRAYATTAEGTVYGDPLSANYTIPATPDPSVTTVEVSQITADGATVRINVVAGSGYTKAGVVYATTAAGLPTSGTPSNKGTEYTGTTSGDKTSVLSGLTKNTTYYVRGYVFTGSQYIYATGNLSFKTLDTTAPTFTTKSVGSITDTSAKVTVNVSAVGSGYTKVGVVYATTSAGLPTSGTPSSSSKSEISSTTTGDKTISVSGLTANKTYYVRGYVLTSSGTYVYATDSKSFTTSSSSDPKVTTDGVESITTTSAKVRIDVTDIGSGYTKAGVVYATSSSSLPTSGTPSSSSKSEISTNNEGEKLITISGLTKDRTYYVKGYVYTGSKYVYASNYKSFTTDSEVVTDANAPSATTSAVTNITATTADVPINITDKGASNITQRGVVYSSESSSPEVGDSDCKTKTASGTTGSTTVTLTGLESGTKYYVCAYAKNSSGYGYGTVRSFTTLDEDDVPSVTTVSVTRVSDTEIDVVINVTAANASKIKDRGVVYSRTLSAPKKKDSGASYESVGGTTTGKVTVHLTGLVSGASYYVRGYATNSDGDGYGAVKSSDGDEDSIVTTNAVTDITNTGATLGGTVSSSDNSSVLERGVVYSRSRTSPTIDDTRERSTKTTSGSYSITVTGLETNVKYYARAYVRTSDGYSYGNTVNFTTGSVNLTLTVLYKTAEGLQVGTQNIPALYNSVITQNSLYVPGGYSLSNPYFSYTVTATATTTVYVKKTSQNAFMEGSSNYLFEPSKKVTRVEVAKMIHNLKGNVYAGEGIAFSDMPTGAAEIAAVKYVSQMKYMVGNPDGTFKPYANITRAEVVVICSTVYGLTATNLTNPFSDTANHWSRDYITIAYKNGILAGYPDGTFKPEQNTTRAEAAVFFIKTEKRDLTPLGTTQFTDVPTSHWAYSYIMSVAIPKR